ncbi:MAG: DNA adenine methylase [Chitinophagaceae bacterium]|nr:DNA adenine methylase [Chitinophagaceae bacterium]MCW5906129.1 DNA adenine methylase [Chitinophagaceae bacterium]
MNSVVAIPEIQTKLFFDKKQRTEFELRKNALIEKLKSSSGKQSYKRYINGTPLRYAGGKTLAVGLIVELLPNNLERIISPFFGGGSFEIACAKELGIEVLGFDIFDMLVNYWQQQIANPEQLYKYLKNYHPTRDGFLEIKEIMKEQWDKKLGKIKPKRTIKNLTELAALFFYNHNTSYGPHFLGWPSSVYLQPDRYNTMIEKARRLKLTNISVECADFEEIFIRYPNDFFYIDPPYYLDGDSKTFVGLYPHRNFPIHHKGFKHEKLRELLLNHKGGFILSYNDCSTIREWYKRFPFKTPSWQYTLSQGDTRIGENRLKKNNGSHVKKSHELLIYNIPNG